MTALSKRDLLARTGSLQQVASVRPVTFREGRADGLTAYAVKNGPLAFDVLADKGLDIGDFSYRGVGFNFLAKPGLIGRTAYDTHGAEAQRSIMGGPVVHRRLREHLRAVHRRCGKDYPMHGRIRTTPAEAPFGPTPSGTATIMCCAFAARCAKPSCSAENLVLRRTIETRLGERTVRIVDEGREPSLPARAADAALPLQRRSSVCCPRRLASFCRFLAHSRATRSADRIWQTGSSVEPPRGERAGNTSFCTNSPPM